MFVVCFGAHLGIRRKSLGGGWLDVGVGALMLVALQLEMGLLGLRIFYYLIEFELQVTKNQK